ncbi:hypothetical protein HOLleu_02686 [Holothuria leucospilota]|uniref:Uncharacterized protein n=1 Tax=Holothuria leucospilota TaxID=206669 RepID=A0A9Q1HLH4_HOLLE|nr:hypothetical protein HOLleu_02686 [Holothuria leucospilota]
MHSGPAIFCLLLLIFSATSHGRPWQDADDDVIYEAIVKRVVDDLTSYQESPAKKRDICWLFFTPYQC